MTACKIVENMMEVIAMPFFTFFEVLDAAFKKELKVHLWPKLLRRLFIILWPVSFPLYALGAAIYIPGMIFWLCASFIVIMLFMVSIVLAAAIDWVIETWNK